MIEMLGGPDRDRTDEPFHATHGNMLVINGIPRHVGALKRHVRSTALKKKCPSLCPRFRSSSPTRRREGGEHKT